MDRRTRTTVIALVLGTALASATGVAAAQVLPHAASVDRLPNGLTVVVVPYDTPGIAAYYTLVRTGSRDEIEAGHSGFAHLFEHMMFRGTQQLSATEYEHRMQTLGADNNAYTTQDFTMFTVTLPSASLPGLVPVEADRFQHLAYEEPVFQTETRAVLGEYNKNSSSPMQQMWETLSELAFSRHTYGHTTMGYLRDILAMPASYAYSQAFFQRYYRPDNTTIIVAGDVQHDAVLSLVRQHYGTWSGRRARPHIAPEPEQRGPRTRALAWEGATAPTLMVGYRIPAFTTSTVDSAALEVVHALAFSASSDLYQRLVVREQRLLVLGSSDGEFRRDPGLFVVRARLTSAATFAEVEQAITEELARVGRGEYARERIEAVISNLRYALPMEIQTPADAANTLGHFMALTGDANALNAYHAMLSRVTPEDVARVARTYLVSGHRSTVTLTDVAHAPPGAIHVGPSVAAMPSPPGSSAPPAGTSSAPPAGTSSAPPAAGSSARPGGGA